MEVAKKVLLKFTARFHPDKQRKEPKKIQLLREEISKMLNDFNEHYKGDAGDAPQGEEL